MAKPIQSVRGMHDVLPAQSPAWQALEATVAQVLGGYGYAEIRMPLVEPTDLFARSIGEVTDIVEKEMYSFEDRNGDRLSLRPEGTAGCVRAGIEHGLLHNQQQRLWYLGPMFRHERPQKGRYRQFHQIGVETFGFEGPDIDAELILITARLWRALGLDGLRLELNSLGSPEERAAYRGELVRYLEQHRDALDADSLRRLEGNPLRVLDSKAASTQAVVAGAPSLMDHLSAESRTHFEGLCARLDAAGIAYEVNPRLVRGLDYYSRTVFEWITDDLGAQGTVCAGGRYDGLVQVLGGRATPAAGFALGIERLLALRETRGLNPDPTEADAYLVAVGAGEQAAMPLGESLREALPGLRLRVNCGGGGLKAQMKRADRCGARVALIIGDEELAADTVTVKWLRSPGAEQQAVARADLVPTLRPLLSGGPLGATSLGATSLGSTSSESTPLKSTPLKSTPLKSTE